MFPYIIILIIVFLIITIFVSIRSKEKRNKGFTPLAGLAFGFILAGLIFGEERIIGYSLIGIGVLLAIIDMVKK